ncbi:MAG: ATP-binding protein [Gammaproteobacteria bacterium]
MNAPAPELDQDTATHLYHIAKESITNAVRHGGVSHVSIDLQNGHQGISLVIADDGDGLPDEQPEGGMGLQLMRLRAEMIGGYLKVDSKGGFGTRVECRIPSN